MILAYHKICLKYDRKYIKNHIHLLGMGSIDRLIPYIYLTKSGFIQNDVKISFDSTTFSMSYIMGRFLFQGKMKNFKGCRKKDWLELFAKSFNYFEDIYLSFFPEIEKDFLIDFLSRQSLSVTKTLVMSDKGIFEKARNEQKEREKHTNTESDHDNFEIKDLTHLAPIIRAHVALSNIFQIIEFSEQLAKEFNENVVINPTREKLLILKNIKTLDQFIDWFLPIRTESKIKRRYKQKNLNIFDFEETENEDK